MNIIYSADGFIVSVELDDSPWAQTVRERDGADGLRVLTLPLTEEQAEKALRGEYRIKAGKLAVVKPPKSEPKLLPEE